MQNVGTNFLANMPEQIGYLKAIGLDYGYGPTSVLECTLEHVHVYSGLPWWSSIIVTAIGLRVVLFPLFIKSSDVAARQSALQPILKPLTNKMMEAYQVRDVQEVQKIRAELKEINARAGISMKDMFIPLTIQGVLAYCALKLMRAMANLPVPGFQTGGALWFSDLTVQDPTYALPLIMAGSLHLLVRFGGESGMLTSAQQQPGMRTLLLYVMPGLIVVTMAWFPAAVNVWLASTGLTGIIQARVLQNKSFRERLNLAPMVRPTVEPAKSTTTSTTTNSNVIDVKGHSRSFSDSASMRYQAPNIKYTTPDNGPEIAQPSAPKPSIVGRSKDWGAEQINNLGDGWKKLSDSMQTSAKKYMAARNKSTSKTRSAEFMKRAEAYERRAQEQRGGKKY